MLKVLLKYHITPQGIRHEDAEFLTNMVIQFANQFVCQVDLNLKLATRRIKFIGKILDFFFEICKIFYFRHNLFCDSKSS